MKQRIGIAMALLGDSALLVLNEPINGLDADGMQTMREVLTDITKDKNRTVLISSHILGELEKIATHYGIIRQGEMLCEMTAAELEAGCRTYISLTSSQKSRAKALMSVKYARVEEDEGGHIRIYDAARPEEIVACLYESGIMVGEIGSEKTNRVKSLLTVDLRRMFRTRFLYIMMGICLVMPILILVMTTTCSFALPEECS